MKSIHYVAAVALVSVATLSTSAEPLPGRLAGLWKITRILPTQNVTCWSAKEAEHLVGTTLTYAQNSMQWKGGSVAITDIFTRTVSAREFTAEAGSQDGKHATFAQLGIHANAVTEVDFQHEDMDITGATTEVPGDAVLMAAPNRIVVSACGVYFEATRAASRR